MLKFDEQLRQQCHSALLLMSVTLLYKSIMNRDIVILDVNLLLASSSALCPTGSTSICSRQLQSSVLENLDPTTLQRII